MPVDHSIRDKKIFIFAGRAKAKAIIGSISDHNRVNPYVFRTFVDFDPSDGKFDKRPAANSPALRAGLDHQAPPIAIEGCRRISPVDIGGYARWRSRIATLSGLAAGWLMGRR